MRRTATAAAADGNVSTDEWTIEWDVCVCRCRCVYCVACMCTVCVVVQAARLLAVAYIVDRSHRIAFSLAGTAEQIDATWKCGCWLVAGRKLTIHNFVVLYIHIHWEVSYK